MGTARHQYTDEFKREAAGLLASSGRPWARLPGSWGLPLRDCGLGATEAAGARRDRRGAPNTQAAIPPGGSVLAAENARLRRENERLRMEREILKKRCAFFRKRRNEIPPIEDQREMFPVRVMCDVMGVSPAGYYAWRGRPESPGKAANRALLTGIQRVHAAHRGRYCAPRIHAALHAEGHKASRGRVERLMRHHGIQAQTQRRFRVCTTDSHHDWPIAPNRLDRNFAVKRPNQV
jgi:transposase-like protein